MCWFMCAQSWRWRVVADDLAATSCHHPQDMAATSHHGQLVRAASSSAQLSTDIVPRSCLPSSVITSKIQQRHYAMINVASATPSSARLHSDIVSCPSRFGSTITNMTRGLVFTSLTSNPTQRFTTDQARRLKEYCSNRQLDSGTLLPTSLTSTRDERVITTMLWDASSNQLSHFLSCIFFPSNVSISIYFQLVNLLF
jgi:hypothetical protein